jgi:peptidoglycan/LPS O-acetylase OafA/YrhL
MLKDTDELPSEKLENKKSQKAKDTKVFFPNLDGLRFIAFFVVFMAHSFYTEIEAIKSDKVYVSVKDTAHLGIFGVNFFFVLSGFLITYLLLNEEFVRGKIDVPSFYMRRILRIWPLYFAVVFVGFVVFPQIRGLMGEPYKETGKVLYFLLFINNFDKVPVSAVLGVLWSIAIEEQFYLFWPLLFRFLPQKFRRYIFPLIVVTSFIFRLLNINNQEVIYFHTLSCITDMAIGGWGAYLVNYRPGWKIRLQFLPKKVIVFVYILGLTLLFARGHWKVNDILNASERLIYSAFFLFVILEQNFAKHSFYKMSNFKSITKLGLYTYGLYVLHVIGIQITNNIFRKLSLNNSLWKVLILETSVSLLISIGIAFVSYHLYEKHFLRLKLKFSHVTQGKDS